MWMNDLWWPSLTGLTADDDKVGSCTTTVADYTRMVDDILRWEMGTALKKEAYVQQFSCGFCNRSAVSPTCVVNVHDVRVSLAEVNASCSVVHGCLLVALYAQSFACQIAFVTAAAAAAAAAVDVLSCMPRRARLVCSRSKLWFFREESSP
jgi:hypothetical protein